MNYEEMLNARDGAAVHKEQMPLGNYYKKLIDHKYRHVVELKHQLVDSLVFCECLKKDQERGLTIRERQQMHYELHEDSSGIYELELEAGNYTTLSQLLADNPAVVAGKGFIEKVLSDLVDIANALHKKGIFYLCYAPQNIFISRTDNVPRLLSPGSSFMKSDCVDKLYEGFEEWVAPEVLAHEEIDQRSDVYALGKLVEYLFSQGDMPMEYRKAVKKATAQDPAKRFKSVADMQDAITKFRSAKRSTIILIVALLVSALGIWLYFDSVPEPVNIEFESHPQPQQQDEDMADDDFSLGGDVDFTDPDLLELMGINPDSVNLSNLTEEEWRQISDSASQMAKAEQIFRKRFQGEAEKQLNRIYENSSMGPNEQRIMAQRVVDDLMKTKDEMAAQAGLDQDRAARIYSDVITKVTAAHAAPQRSTSRSGSRDDN